MLREREVEEAHALGVGDGDASCPNILIEELKRIFAMWTSGRKSERTHGISFFDSPSGVMHLKDQTISGSLYTVQYP